jgi:hypothetical protein
MSLCTFHQTIINEIARLADSCENCHRNTSAEAEARAVLSRMGLTDEAADLTNGDLVELANILSDAKALAAQAVDGKRAAEIANRYGWDGVTNSKLLGVFLESELAELAQRRMNEKLNRREIPFRRGDVVRGKLSGLAYIVDEVYSGRAVAVRTVDITNPDEWVKVHPSVPGLELVPDQKK